MPLERIMSLRDQSADLFKFEVVLHNEGDNDGCDMEVDMSVSGLRCIFINRFIMDLAGTLQ